LDSVEAADGWHLAVYSRPESSIPIRRCHHAGTAHGGVGDGAEFPVAGPIAVHELVEAVGAAGDDDGGEEFGAGGFEDGEAPGAGLTEFLRGGNVFLKLL